MGYFKNKTKKAEPRPAKTKRIDTRFTADEHTLVTTSAEKCGMPPSIYIHNLAVGHRPKERMTASQEEALKGLIGARAEVMGIRNVLRGMSQAERKRMFRDPEFMNSWIDALDPLLLEWTKIRDQFV